MNRLDRLTAILIQLQSKRVIKAQEIAERFEISLRTVYRDIRTLEEAGVPIIGEAGIGYSLMEGYRLPPVMFTQEEATAFLAAEKLVEKLTDNFTSTSYQSAMYKIKAVLKHSEKHYLEDIASSIAVLENPYLPKINNQTVYLQKILHSIAEKKVLRMHYFANHNQANTERLIEPLGVFLIATTWHLVAYCQLRTDYRDFRIDRINSLEETTLCFQKEHPPLQEYLPKMRQQTPVHTVVIRVKKTIVRYLGDQKYYNGFVSQRDLGEEVEMTFITASLYGFARWFLYFANEASIDGPVALQTLIQTMLEEIIAKQGGSCSWHKPSDG